MAELITRLPGRTALCEQLDLLLAERQNTRQRLAILLIDIDRFGALNDAAGMTIGDKVLIEMAMRIQDVIRSGDVLARIGDDEFAVILPGIQHDSQAMLAAAKICEACDLFVNMQQQGVKLGVRTGIAIFPKHGMDSEDLLRRAGLALAEAKQSRHKFCIFEQKYETQNISFLRLEYELREALDQTALSLYYQPQVDSQSGAICGVEALTRWFKPDGNAIPPDTFIGVAEESGLIHPLTHWCLKTALGQVSKWLGQGRNLTMAVNISPRVFEEPGLHQLVDQILEIWGVPPENLVLEITEGAVMKDPQHALVLLHELNDMGIALSIDDFGTGYSSLAYLRQLPIRELKIDRSFVNEMSKPNGDESIVRAVIDMARNFSLRVVAEGVEDKHTMDRLIDLGCDIIQGYFISKPKPPEDISGFLESNQANTRLASS